MAWQPPMVNQITADIKDLSIFLLSIKKFGKTTLFRDVIMEKYGDPTRGLLVGCGSEIGYTLLDNLNCTQVETYQDLIELGNWLITEKGKSHNIEIVAFDTIDELVQICDKETIARSKKESGKEIRSVGGAFGGYGRGDDYTANNLIKPFMSTLKKAGFGVWAIGHTSMKTIKNKGDIEEEGYQMLTSSTNKKSASVFGDIFDVTLVGVIDRNMTTKIKDGFNGKKIKENFVTDEVRKLYFRGTPVIDAGGRFAEGAVPEYLVFDKGNMAAEFIKTVEDGIEKSKTNHSPVKKPKADTTVKVEIKADTDDVGEPVDGGLFEDTISTPTEDIESLKKQIIDKCIELGGTQSSVVNEALEKFGNPNALKEIEKAKEYLEYIS